MAVQHGPIQLTGQLGGVSYYEMDGKYYARRKTAHSAERIRTDPAFKSTHQNSLEFGRASMASKLMRKAWKEMGGSFADNRMYSRLNGCFKKVMHGDTRHKRGERTVTDGDFTQLLNFELNKHKSFEASFPSKPAAKVNRAAGQVTLLFSLDAEAIGHSKNNQVPLFIAIACVNFLEETHSIFRSEGKLEDFIVRDNVVFEVPACSDPRNAVIITLGVSHNDAVGGKAITDHGAMAVVGVEAPVNASMLSAEIPHRATPAGLAIDTPVNILRHPSTWSFRGDIPVPGETQSHSSDVATLSRPCVQYRAQPLRGGVRCRSC